MNTDSITDDVASLRASHDRLKLLYQVGKVIHSTLDQEQALQLIMQETVRVMRASSAAVALLNPNNGLLEIRASAGMPAAAGELKLRIGQGVTGWVIRTGKPARVGDVRKDSRYIMIQSDVLSELAVPLEVMGEVRGVLNVDSQQTDAFSQSDQELLEELAAQAAKVIHNTWLFEQSRLKARLLETLVSVSRSIHSALHVDEALQLITREACSLMDARMSSLLMLDPTSQWLDLRASFGAGPSYLAKPRLHLDESFMGIVIRRKKPMQMENVQSSTLYQNAAMAREEGLVSLLSAPLIYSGQTIGTLNVYTSEPRSFSNEEVHILTALTELSAIAIEKARLYERVVDLEEQLRQNEKLSALGLLAAEVAHEIRNPLTVMKMLYHSLGLNFPPGDPRVRDDAILRGNMDHLNKIVEQILDFARGTEPKPAPVNLNQILDDLALLIRHKLHNQKIHFVRRLAPESPVIQADGPQLAQAFLNITLNAVESMPSGGTLTLTTRLVNARKSGGKSRQVLIQFRDTGQGMPEEQRRGRHSSLLSTTKQKGTGLGLAIVGRVIETHHGKIRILTRPGKGTAITVILPA